LNQKRFGYLTYNHFQSYSNRILIFVLMSYLGGKQNK